MAERIPIASDHAGFEMKEKLEKVLTDLGYEVEDLGTHSPASTDYPDYAHPIDITEQFVAEYPHLAKQVQQKQKLAEPIPYLAQLVAASPLDAALHDAYGRVHGKNSYNVLSSEYVNHDLSEYLDASFKGEYLDKYTLR